MRQQFRMTAYREARWMKGSQRMVERPESVVEVDIPEDVIRRLAARAVRNRSGKAQLGGITARVITTAPWTDRPIREGEAA